MGSRTGTARSDGEREGDYRIQGEFKVIQNVDWIVASTPAEVAQLQWLYNTNPKLLFGKTHKSRR